MDIPSKPTFILDTSPLSVLCSFPLRGQLYIHKVLQYANLILPDDVITEVGRGKIIQSISSLLKTGTIQSLTTPSQPTILDSSYSRDLGLGERAVIKCGLSTGLTVVLDDKDAFITASRFGLHPLVFQDFIVRLVSESAMPRTTAIEIVGVTARQFPATYLAHTLEMLS